MQNSKIAVRFSSKMESDLSRHQPRSWSHLSRLLLHLQGLCCCQHLFARAHSCSNSAGRACHWRQGCCLLPWSLACGAGLHSRNQSSSIGLRHCFCLIQPALTFALQWPMCACRFQSHSKSKYSLIMRDRTFRDAQGKHSVMFARIGMLNPLPRLRPCRRLRPIVCQ